MNFGHDTNHTVVVDQNKFVSSTDTCKKEKYKITDTEITANEIIVKTEISRCGRLFVLLSKEKTYFSNFPYFTPGVKNLRSHDPLLTNETKALIEASKLEFLQMKSA